MQEGRKPSKLWELRGEKETKTGVYVLVGIGSYKATLPGSPCQDTHMNMNTDAYTHLQSHREA